MGGAVAWPVMARPRCFLFVVRRPPMKYHTSGIGETGEVSPMLLRWIDYDPVALVVLMVGIGAISLLALTM
jgi:hypothetical protein